MPFAGNRSRLRITYLYCNFIRKSHMMYTKLTLNIDKSVIEQAKKYAKSQKISLSRLVESYLASIIDDSKNDIEITPLVKNLSGVIQLDSDFDHKEAYTDKLTKKYR